MTAGSMSSEATAMMHLYPQDNSNKSSYHNASDAVECMPGTEEKILHPIPKATIENMNLEGVYLLAWQALQERLHRWQLPLHYEFDSSVLMNKQVEWTGRDSRLEEVQDHELDVGEQTFDSEKQHVTPNFGPTSNPSGTCREVGGKIRRYEELERRRRLPDLEAQQKCERNIRKLQGQIERLQAELEESRRECSHLRSSLEAQEIGPKASEGTNTNESAYPERRPVHCESDSTFPYADGTAKLAELSAQLTESDNLLADKRNEVVSLRRHLLEANAETDENRDIADDLRHQMEDSNERLWTLQTETNRDKVHLEQTILDLNEELVKNRTENEAHVAVLQEQNFVRGVELLEAQATARDLEEKVERLRSSTSEEIAGLHAQKRQLVARKYCNIFQQQAQLLIRERKDEKLRAEIRGIYDKNEKLLEQHASTETRLEDLKVSQDF